MIGHSGSFIGKGARGHDIRAGHGPRGIALEPVGRHV